MAPKEIFRVFQTQSCMSELLYEANFTSERSKTNFENKKSTRKGPLHSKEKRYNQVVGQMYGIV